MRHLKAFDSQTVLLFEDETKLRLFPVIRRAWSRRGEQGRVLISGRNATRVLLGAINPRTGHRLTARSSNMRQEHFQSFLRLLRHHYRDRPLALLLDEGPNHTAQRSIALAARLNIDLIWLPKQCSELNAMDQLWRGVRQDVSANVQYKTIDAHAAFADAWVHSLTPTEALRKASVLSENFWLKDRWT